MWKLNKRSKTEQTQSLKNKWKNNILHKMRTDTLEKQSMLGKIVELLKKDNFPKPQNLKIIDRVTFKEKIELIDNVRHCIDKKHYSRQQDHQVWSIIYYPIV